MRIYYFSGATIPSDAAKSVHVMKMCQAWGDAGHDVRLFGKGRYSDAFSYYGVRESFTLSLSPHVKIPFVSGAIRLLSCAAGLSSLPVPDLIYGRDPVALTLFTPPNVCAAFELHQIPYLAAHKWAIGKLIKRDNFKGVVCISDGLRQDFAAMYPDFPSHKIFVAHDGADIMGAPDTLMHIKEHEVKGREGVYRAGYSGSLHAGKGGDHIVDLAMQCLDIDFHVWGGTAAQVEALSARASDNVYFYGHVPHSELPAYLCGMDTLLAPYSSEAKIKSGQDISKWISPMKLFEYMALKRPIICSDLPVIREVLTHDDNALLAVPDDVQSWTVALDRLREGEELAERISLRAYDHLAEKFSWKKRAADIAKFCMR